MLVHKHGSVVKNQLTFALGKTQEARVVSLVKPSFSLLACWNFVGRAFHTTCTSICLLTQKSSVDLFSVFADQRKAIHHWLFRRLPF